MKPIIIVTGVPRSGTSLMMRTLEMGGIPCRYKKIKNPLMVMRNPFGNYEGGEIPENGGVAIKRFIYPHNIQEITPYDCYFIFMDRPPYEILNSWNDIISKLTVNENAKPIELSISHIMKRKQEVLSYIIDKKHIVIKHRDMFDNHIETLSRIKEFLPFPFDVEFAAQALNRTLFIERSE